MTSNAENSQPDYFFRERNRQLKQESELLGRENASRNVETERSILSEMKGGSPSGLVVMGGDSF